MTFVSEEDSKPVPHRIVDYLDKFEFDYLSDLDSGDSIESNASAAQICAYAGVEDGISVNAEDANWNAGQHPILPSPIWC